MLQTIIRLFPIWAVAFSLLAYFQPILFTGFKSSIVPLLMVIMLCMGATLKPDDFLNVLKNRKAVGIGVVLQFTVMPMVALVISLLLNFDSSLTIGMVLVGSVAGGTASNVMCYLAKGDVALSISMTALSTLLGIVLTPLLVDVLGGRAVNVPVDAMLVSLVRIVLFPVAAGAVLNRFAGRAIDRISAILPLVSMAAIVFIIAVVVALNAKQFAQIGPVVALAVVLHNGFGLLAGYQVCKYFGFDETVCRTIAFEVGLQNSGLAVALAMKFFSPVSAMPGTVFSVWHNLSGSLLAGYWSRSCSDVESGRDAKTWKGSVG